MPLKIYYSDRIEDLANHLKERLLRDRTGADPFVFPQVVVPNTNIAKWLQIRILSKERMLCAGIRFPFMEQRLTDLMAANLPEGAPFSLLPDHAYANAIMAALLAPRDAQPEFDALAPLRDYVSGAGESGGAASGGLAIRTQRQARMGWQLAVKMADLMDEYEVRRPEIVENWLRGLPAEGRGQTETSRIELAEAALARCLWGRGGAFPPDGEQLSLRQLYDRVSGAPPKGPSQTIYFFGHSTLSLLQVKILAWLARTRILCLARYRSPSATAPEKSTELPRTPRCKSSASPAYGAKSRWCTTPFSEASGNPKDRGSVRGRGAVSRTSRCLSPTWPGTVPP